MVNIHMSLQIILLRMTKYLLIVDYIYYQLSFQVQRSKDFRMQFLKVDYFVMCLIVQNLLFWYFNYYLIINFQVLNLYAQHYADVSIQHLTLFVEKILQLHVLLIFLILLFNQIIHPFQHIPLLIIIVFVFQLFLIIV